MVHVKGASCIARYVETVLAVGGSLKPTRNRVAGVEIHHFEGGGEDEILIVILISLDLSHARLARLVT
jgi:hypothetical protein